MTQVIVYTAPFHPSVRPTMSRKYINNCVDCGDKTSKVRCKPCANRESAPRRFASLLAGGKHSGWPAGVPRTAETKAAIRAGMKVSPSQQARRVWSICAKCSKQFKSGNAGQKHCSRTCAFTGRTVTTGGYIAIHMGQGKRKLEHRLVMEQILGRPLARTEQVHHKDANKLNNAPSNLELRSGPHGAGATRHCPTCTCCNVTITQA